MVRSAEGRRRGLAGAGAVAAAALVAATMVAPASDASPKAAPAAAAQRAFKQVNLVSDVPGLARMTDFLMSNPWGIAAGPTTPIWINNEGSATSVVYSGANGTDPLERRLVVQTPSHPTGIAFNPTTAFAARQNGQRVPSLFLFNHEDGYTSAWGPTADPITEAIATKFERTRGYLGMAVAQTKQGPRMYGVRFQGQGTRVATFNGRFQELSGSRFVDPRAAGQGLFPYNVAVIGSRVYVAYFNPNFQPGGAVSVFDLNGMFVRRLITSDRLFGAWGMAMAPDRWGGFHKALLVGNVDNGRINAFSRRTGAFLGTLRGADGKPLVNEGLWGIQFGNGVTGTPRTLLFVAGIDGYIHGLFGLIRPM
jgi:uncharacterized protein (TIGR03118 family)